MGAAASPYYTKNYPLSPAALAISQILARNHEVTIKLESIPNTLRCSTYV